jgi:transcription initiation factor TFIID subunit 2
MKSIGQALLGKKEPHDDDIEFDMERELQRQAEDQLDKDCIAEIDRYRRMDEWTSSFHNVYSRTAIGCQFRLMQANVLDMDVIHFIQYTRPGTFEPLRLEAFEILAELNLFRRPELLTWFMYNMSSDISLWMRRNLHRVFGRSLADVAFGKEDSHHDRAATDGLVIEQESSTEARQAQLARRQTTTGAIAALKQELSGNPVLREAMWAACNSPFVGLSELCDFVDLCAVLYDSIEQKLVKLRYPRYWSVQHLGKVSSKPIPAWFEENCLTSITLQQGKLKFKQTGRVRTVPLSKIIAGQNQPPPPNINGSLKRKRENTSVATPAAPSHKITLKVPKLYARSTPSNSQPTPSPQPSGGARPKLIFKLKKQGSDA